MSPRLSILSSLCRVEVPAASKQAYTCPDIRALPQALLHPHVFLDVAIGAAPVGRIEIELNAKLCPKTAENFRCRPPAAYVTMCADLGRQLRYVDYEHCAHLNGRKNV